MPGAEEAHVVATSPAHRVALLWDNILGTGPIDHLHVAVIQLRAAEESEGCAWCAGHIRAVRVLAEDLVRVAEMGEEIGRGEVGNLARAVGAAAEEIGALGALARIVHRLKGAR